MKRGIYAGSFDPPTRGHLDVMRRASLIVDELHVMIGVNPKKSGGFFPVATRLNLRGAQRPVHAEPGPA